LFFSQVARRLLAMVEGMTLQWTMMEGMTLEWMMVQQVGMNQGGYTSRTLRRNSGGSTALSTAAMAAAAPSRLQQWSRLALVRGRKR
jgi:hypothetical protein